MGYKIQYGPTLKIEKKHTDCNRKYMKVLACSIFLFALLLVGYYAGGADVIRNLFLPGDAEVTASALADMSENIRQGKSIQDAFTAFCKEIIENAEVS